MRILTRCDCWDGPAGWSTILGTFRSPLGPALDLQPEAEGCACDWMLVGDWDPEVVLEVRQGSTRWGPPRGRRRRSTEQLELFGGAA